MTRMAETAYLLGTVDDMGVARVFAYHCQSIYLLSVINIMKDVNKRSICLAFELSEGGEYGAASISCNSAACLEVYHFPSEAWLKELETARSHQQDQDSSEDVGVEWSPVALVCKIKPPKVPAGTVLDGSLEALQITDFFTHCLALDVETSSSCQQKKQSFDTDAGKTKETNESPRRCTQHFLLPCGQFPGDTIAKSQPGLPVAVCVWWSGSHNLLQYFLQKAPKNKQDVDPMPDVLWPNSKEILCSAVSTCTRYIALGLNNALVCVWDRLSGSPLSVVCVTAATDSAFFRMQFVDSWPRTADDIQTFTPAKVHLLVLCKSGAIHTVTTGRGAQACTEQLTGRPKDSGDLPTVTAPVPFLQSLSLVVQRNGKVLLQDVINKTTVCFLIPPTTHVIATPCNPVYALNSRQQTLFIQGDLDPSCSASSTDGSQSKLFIFRFGEPGIIKQYILPLPDSPREQNTLSCVTLEESCNLYLQQRQVTWKQLQETAVTQQRGHSRAAAN